MNHKNTGRSVARRTRRHLFSDVEAVENRKTSPNPVGMQLPDERIKRARPDNPFNEVSIR